MNIIVSKEEIKEYEKLKIISQLTLVREKIQLFKTKYSCALEEFEKTVKEPPEDFERWDDYIEWKAYHGTFQDLSARLAEIDNVQDIRIAEDQ